jgi:hypothetical protein
MRNRIRIIAFILLSLSQLSFFSQCPPKGDNLKPKFQYLDSLKNRTSSSNTITPISLDSILKPGDDTKRFNSSQYVSIIGYVFEVKLGGSETCNCRTKDKSQFDIHIEIVKDLNDAAGNKRMIVEINRYARANDKSLDYALIHSLKGKKVEVQGLLFFDDEHKQNAQNTRPDGTNIWRATCWEVHPCLSIKEIK